MNQPIASFRHTLSVLAILAVFTTWGAFNAAHLRATGAQHHILLYTQTFVFEWVLVAYLAWGVRRRGVALTTLFGPPWTTPREFFRDVGVAAAYWCVSLIALGLLSRLLHITKQRENVGFLLPNGPLEMAFWVVLATTAGICEEAIFRGYLQRQFLALTRSPAAAIAISALIFGAGHIYQGYRGAVLIACYGAMFGTLAHWRQSVRPGMIAHAWQDTVSGIAGSLIRK